MNTTYIYIHTHIIITNLTSSKKCEVLTRKCLATKILHGTGTTVSQERALSYKYIDIILIVDEIIKRYQQSLFHKFIKTYKQIITHVYISVEEIESIYYN